MKSSERKIEIINASLKIIGDSGFSGLTTAKIAQEINITEAALYRHFKSKSQIMQSTVQMIGQKLLSTIEKIASENEGVKETLYKILDLHLNHIQQNRGIPRIIYSQETHSDPDLRKNLDQIISKYLTDIEKILKKGKEKGEIPSTVDTNVEAMRFLSIIQFTAFRYSLSGFKKQTIKFGESLWNSFFKNLVS